MVSNDPCAVRIEGRTYKVIWEAVEIVDERVLLINVDYHDGRSRSPVSAQSLMC